MDRLAVHEQYRRWRDHNFTINFFNGTNIFGEIDYFSGINPLNSTDQFQATYQEADLFYFVLDCIVVPFLFGFVTLTGVIGNSLVIYVICRKQKMRTLTNLLLLNLALADLSFVLICPPFTAYESATHHWPFHGILGDVVCKLMHYLLNVTAYVTIYTLVLIAALRYFTIVHGVATVKYRTKKVISLLICGIWTTMLLVNIPITMSYGVQIHSGYPYCQMYGPDIGKKLYATFFVFAYLLPLAVIGLFSLGILLHINASSTSTRMTSRSECRKKHASRLVISVVLIFAIFWFPVHIHLLMVYFNFSSVPDTKFYNAVFVLFQFLAYFNSCINPVIYDSTSKDFRTAFREAVCCRRPESGAQSDRNIPLLSANKPAHEINGNNKDLVAQLTHEEALNSPTSARSVCV